MSGSIQHIRPLIQSNHNQGSRIMGYTGLGIGFFLLLISVQMFVNMQQLLKKDSPRTAGYDYISISKNITNENMGQNNFFNPKEVKELSKQAGIDAVSPLISNQYQVSAHAGNILPFNTDLFLESIDESFLDTLPPGFSWKPGQTQVPLIFSADFLELYNVFAPAQDLPQISPQSITSVNLFLECSGPDAKQTFQGKVVGLSDRVNAVLVPQSFMKWSNEYFADKRETESSRLFIKTKDANDPSLLSFFDKNGYHLNKEKVKFGRLKSVLQNVISLIGIFGMLIVVMALIQFSFYIQLIIARSKENLKLLISLGYSPVWLTGKVSRIWLPYYFVIILVALAATQIIQLLFSKMSFVSTSRISPFIHWSVWITALLFIGLTVIVNFRSTGKELTKIK